MRNFRDFSHCYACHTREIDPCRYLQPVTRSPDQSHTHTLLLSGKRPPAPDLALLAALKTGRERFQLIDKVFYLHAPDGIGRSKLAEKVEKALSVATTLQLAYGEQDG